MASLIKPIKKISTIFNYNQDVITRKQHRRQILWKLGVIPLHPYKLCSYCNNEQDASREHISACMDFNNSLPTKQDWNITYNYPTEANQLDILLDNLPQLNNNPTNTTIGKWKTTARFVERICCEAINTITNSVDGQDSTTDQQLNSDNNSSLDGY